MKTLAAWACITGAFLSGFDETAQAQDRQQRLGSATVHLAPKGGDAPLPPAPWRTPSMLQRAATTNQWYSTLIFNREPFPVFAQPLSVRPTRQGLEVALPRQEVVPTKRLDTEIAFPHRDPVLLTPTAMDSAPARLAAADDWSIRIAMGAQEGDFTAIVAHGSPYVHLHLARGDLRLRLPSPGALLDASDPRRLVLETAQRPFAFYLPNDGRWEQVSPLEWIGRLPTQARHVTVAALPDTTPQSLALLSRHAFIRPLSTHVRWHFDEAKARVRTTFSATTEVLEGEDTGPLYGLYPHHWHANASVSGRLGPAYATVRGPIRLLAARDFSTDHPFFGFVPFLPPVSEPSTAASLRELMDSDVRNARRYMLPEGQSAYWQGKGFQRVLKLVDVLEQQGRTEAASQLLDGVKRRLEEWLGGADRKRYFFLDRSLGVLTTHPSEFHAVEEINDQHFWFGYWIRTVAELALRDPAWASESRWGAIVDLMVSNIANADRSRRDFPFLRTFDPYEGHSWANGLGGVGEYGLLGNNQESSSEALNAWAGLLLWAEFKGDRSLRALAAYLLSTEWQAVEHYWFDVHRIVLPPQYRNVDVAMVFGAGYAHNTWWTDEPRQISGINLLPITTSSTPLARQPDYIRRNLDSLREEEKLAASRWVRGKPPDIWQDIFAKYRAMADPEQALKEWNRWGAIELGETRSATLHWIQSLRELGLPDFSVWADTPLHAVFKRPDGMRTYLAFNASAQPLEVRFSDGVRLTVGPRRLSQTQGKSD